MKRLSLVTTVLNEASSIDDLAEAIHLQSVAPDEWIVADAGSTDGTPERLRASGLARIVVEPGNIARGRNRAIAEAHGDIVVVTDAGCRPDRRWIERLVSPIETGKADIVAGPTRPRIRTPFDAAQWVLQDQFLGSRAAWRRPTVSSRSLAFRRSLWERRRYPEWLDHGEDRWLAQKWIETGARVEFVEDDDAAVEWEMRPGLAAFFMQHFRYMRGDGLAAMRTGRNVLRLLFYGGLAFGAAAGLAWQRPTWAAAAALWLLYLGVTLATRFSTVSPNRSTAFHLATLLWAPPLLLLMDCAKIAGYVSGLLGRLTKRSEVAR